MSFRKNWVNFAFSVRKVVGLLSPRTIVPEDTSTEKSTPCLSVDGREGARG